MASLKKLNDKIKTFNDFKKVVNIQKVVVMKEIAEWKKVVDQSKFRNKMFSNLMLDIQSKYKIYDPALFSDKRNIVPIDRDLHFIIGPKGVSEIAKYSNKLILEHAKKEQKPEDLYVIVGIELAKTFEKNDLNVMHVISSTESDNIELFKRISFQLLRAFKDLMFKKTDLLFFNEELKQIETYPILPFSNTKVDLNSGLDYKIKSKTVDVVTNINLSKTEFQQDLTYVSEHISSLAIEMKTYSIMVDHKLSVKLRELQSLEDKEKNINEEIARVVLMAQRVRKENVTNELLTNATAFQALTELEEEE